MRHVKTLGLCLVAVFALAAMTASGASAGGVKPGLVLLEENTPAPAGASAFGVIQITQGGCFLATTGTLSNNKGKKDKAALGGESFGECSEEGYTISGDVGSAQLTTSGAMSFKAAVTLTLPNGCSYFLKKYKVGFNTHEAFATQGAGEETAKRSKGSCAAKTIKISFNAFLDTGSLAEFGTEIS